MSSQGMCIILKTQGHRARAQGFLLFVTIVALCKKRMNTFLASVFPRGPTWFIAIMPKTCCKMYGYRIKRKDDLARI